MLASESLSNRRIAAQFRLTEQSLRRHRSSHLSPSGNGSHAGSNGASGNGASSPARRRLRALTSDCRRALRLAAVVGKRFDVATLLRADGLDRGRLVALLGEAEAAGVVRHVPGAVAYEFTYPGIADELYGQIGSLELGRLHRRVGEAIEALNGSDVRPIESELCGHYLQAVLHGEHELAPKAVEYARRAGDRALAQHAGGEAAGHYECALDLLRLAPDEDLRAELLLCLGRARWTEGKTAEARDANARVAEIARRSGDVRLLAKAALAFSVSFRFGAADNASITLLEEAIEALGDRDRKLRALLEAHLATHLSWTAGREQRDVLGRRAVEAARASGDPEGLARVLLSRVNILQGPEHLHQRIADLEEVRLIARTEANGRLASLRLIAAALESGDPAALDARMDAVCRQVEELGIPRLRWHAAGLKAMRATFRGRFDEELLNEALALGNRAGDSDAAQVYAVQLGALRREQGRLSELRPWLEDLAERFPAVPAWRCALAFMHGEAEDVMAARGELERLAVHDLAAIARDSTISMALLAEVCGFLGDGARASTIYELLLPYAGRCVMAGEGAACYGAVSHYLGVLAGAMGRVEEAERHFSEALGLHERLGAFPFVAHTQRAWGELLRARDGERATSLLRRAEAAYRELGMTAFAERTAARLTDGGPRRFEPGSMILAARQAATGRFVREGDFWTIAYDGVVLRLNDLSGLRYIVRLLQNPGGEVHAVDLVSPEAVITQRPRDPDLVAAGVHMDTGDAGELIDPRARSAYRKRLLELRDEIEEASSWGDTERASRARAEMQTLADELSRGVGLSGKPRRAASEAERARQNVTRAIRKALKRIEAGNPSLGLYLSSTIRTGTFCSYTPDPRLPVTWTF